ncbi:MAG: alpha/beta family hydrolase [Rhodovibrionaceae bacterium]|nr:alpha/beta family hydrolase [Rhodovibrionaceae bacterium]
MSGGPPALVFDGPKRADLTLALAHGAGAPMDSPFMNEMAQRLAAKGWRVARFEFPYMAARRADGRKRPPDAQTKRLDCWRQVAEALGPERLAAGGKSMGGRMASLLAADMEAEGAPLKGVLCLGYPFHPPGRPEKLRIAHLERLATPTLIVQGTRDPFGTREEVSDYALSPHVRVAWMEDGDHSLAPRKASGRTPEQNLDAAAAAADAFLRTLAD